MLSAGVANAESVYALDSDHMTLIVAIAMIKATSPNLQVACSAARYINAKPPSRLLKN